jgi:hypothetical protein
MVGQLSDFVCLLCAQSPALKLLLERYPDLLSKSTEQLEAELDAKFDKAIRTKGTTHHLT